MSHNEKRGHWTKEGLISSATGMLFGASYVAMSHPFDTIQTKMQAQKGFEGSNLFGTIVKVMKTDGIKGFYRGVVPPLWGSGIYRSIQFSAFEATYTFLENDLGKKKIPLTRGLETRVIIGGIMSGTFRAIVETPLEYAKIKRQMGQTYKLRECYTGLKITWMRSCTLMPTYFIFLDSFRRNLDTFFRTNALGPFIISGVSGVLGWWVCWPLELMKCQIQAGYLKEKNFTILQRMKYAMSERGGFVGLYRGLAAGTIKCFLGNGFGMVVLVYAQRKITEWGLRK